MGGPHSNAQLASLHAVKHLGARPLFRSKSNGGGGGGLNALGLSP